MGVKDTLTMAYAITKAHGQAKSFRGLKSEVKQEFGLNNEGMTQLVTGFIALAIIVAIGVIILANVSAAMPAVNESSAYYALQSTVETTTVSSYSLIIIILIIVAAAGIMAAVALISGRRN
jgi:hypothetical protein